LLDHVEVKKVFCIVADEQKEVLVTSDRGCGERTDEVNVQALACSCGSQMSSFMVRVISCLSNDAGIAEWELVVCWQNDATLRKSM